MSPRLRAMVQMVACEHKIDASILARGKSRKSVAARAEVFRRLRSTGMSLTQIGRLFGMHHTSVLYHVGKMPPAPVHSVEKDYIDLSGEWAI